MGKATVCANINAKGKRRRMTLGVVALAVSVALHFVAPADAGAAWKVVGLALLAYGWLCVIQAAMNTCVLLASQGTRETDGGTAHVDDAELAAALRRRARVVWILTVFAWVATIGALGAVDLLRK